MLMSDIDNPTSDVNRQPMSTDVNRCQHQAGEEPMPEGDDAAPPAADDAPATGGGGSGNAQGAEVRIGGAVSPQCDFG